MAATVVSTQIDRPADVVFEYVTDPRKFHEWQAGVIDGRMANDSPPAIGDHCLTTRKIGLSKQSSTSEVVHVDPPRTWGVRGIDGPIRAIVDVTVEPLDASRTTVTISVDFAGHGIGHLLVPLLVRGQARNEMPANLAALRRQLQ
jgi:uncharacterized protein YndB with AHSA1/START domain